MSVYELSQNNVLKSIHCIIRNKNTEYEGFVFHSNRLIRLVLERCFELMPYQDSCCSTPIGETYYGKALKMDICAVSVIRAGESMEQEFKLISPKSPIGKILIQRDKITKKPKFFYECLPEDIAQRYVLVMEPMLATGGSAIMAIARLLAHNIPQRNICIANILSSPEGLEKVTSCYPEITLVTSSIEKCLNPEAFMIPGIGDFGDRYFGTLRRGAEHGQT